MSNRLSPKNSHKILQILTSPDYQDIIEYILNEKLMTEQLVQDRMDLGLEYWRGTLLIILAEERDL